MPESLPRSLSSHLMTRTFCSSVARTIWLTLYPPSVIQILSSAYWTVQAAP